MSGGARIWKVSYHRGALFALVETETPEQAIEIAKAHRLHKFGRRKGLASKPPKSVLADRYEVALASERDIAWSRGFGIGTFVDMLSESRKGRPRSRKAPAAGTPEGAEATTRAGGQIGEAA